MGIKIKVVGPDKDRKEFINKNISNGEIILFEHDVISCDYIVYINDDIIGSYTPYETENVGILVTKRRNGKHYLASINIGDYILHLEIPDNYIIRDEIFLLKNISYTLEDGYHHYRMASIIDTPNVNGYMYSKQEMNNALLDERVQLMLKENTLGVEFSLSSSKSYDDMHVINPTNCIGYVVAVGSRFLFIKENCNYSVKEVPKNDKKCIAFMRYICNIGKAGACNKVVLDMKITTWDIWFSTSLPKDYAKDVLGIFK